MAHGLLVLACEVRVLNAFNCAGGPIRHGNIKYPYWQSHFRTTSAAAVTCVTMVLQVLLWGKVTKYLRHLPLVKERALMWCWWLDGEWSIWAAWISELCMK